MSHTKLSCHPLPAHIPLGWGGVSGICQDEASRVYWAQRDQDLAVWREGSALVECVREKFPILEPHNSVSLRFCQEPNLSREGPVGVKRRRGASQV